MKQIQLFVYIVGITIILRGGITPELKTQFRILFEFVIYAWSLSFVNLILCQGALNGFGIRPRTQGGLLGILFAPFLHKDWEHLITNTAPFFILGWFVMLEGVQDFFLITAFIQLFSGLGTWLFARPYTNHIGASDIIFGYLGFLLMRSCFVGDALSVVLTVIGGFMYGRILWGIFPIDEAISWEGHFFGLLAGVFCAYFLDALQGVFSATI
ncbi:MAG TPA: rhomboid family intramembrane serine protease [Chroococcales cyanobacterium]